MGIFSDIKAMTDLQKIKSRGGKAKLSISQIVCLIVNMPDAQRNLPPEQFKLVYAFYTLCRQSKTKVKMDYDGYLDTASKLILKFNEIAPYEKYSGNGEVETQLLLDELRENYEKGK